MLTVNFSLESELELEWRLYIKLEYQFLRKNLKNEHIEFHTIFFSELLKNIMLFAGKSKCGLIRKKLVSYYSLAGRSTLNLIIYPVFINRGRNRGKKMGGRRALRKVSIASMGFNHSLCSPVGTPGRRTKQPRKLPTCCSDAVGRLESSYRKMIFERLMLGSVE